MAWDKLDIRPPYQREFIYKDKQRDAVIDTASREFPLNVMYWAVRDDGNYEVIDGQQRTISLCQYAEGDFSVQLGSFPEKRAFHNLQKDEKQALLDYKLMVYLCSGTDSEKLEWFRTINIAGEELTDQELLNAVYHGSWVSDAKRYFSKSNCPAYALGSDYLSGSVIRQDFLETAISWASENGGVEKYMSAHQHDPSANDLWLYFSSVLNWVKAVFPHYRREMKGVPWGFLYNDFQSAKLDPKALEEEVSGLMVDEDVTNKKGIYSYVLSRKEKHLNIRSFSPNQRREAYERQAGVCPICQEHFDLSEMESDHITPWHEGGLTSAENCQMLCREDNRRKSGK
ncbi:GmrSD restriction endonuclease domain-containing protein [Parasphingorhabdus sp.]|uniref:GmrSD restriction endonuclease domain-containing protein n=1 Tax=Parasphingorhabdus sp. TaxID=2709688 RepID=UPI003002220E